MRLADRFPSAVSTSPKLDYYPEAEAWKPTAETTLADLLDAIRNGDFAEQVAAVRELVEAGDIDSANSIKKKIPAVSLSGIVRGRRKKAVEEGRFEHSGLLQIDLDAKDNPGWTIERLRAALEADPRMRAVFLSPSGNGLKGVARCLPDAARHRESFLAAEAHFRRSDSRSTRRARTRCGCVSIVRSGCVEGRRTGPMFEVRNRSSPATMSSRSTTRGHCARRAPLPGKSGGLVIRGRAPYDAPTIREMLRTIPYPGYDEWLKIANAVWREIGIPEGTPLLQEWAPEKNPGDYEKHAKYPLQDVTIGTVVMRAKEHGWSPPPPVSAAAPERAARTTLVEENVTRGRGNDHGIRKGDPGPHFSGAEWQRGKRPAARHIFAVIAPTRRMFVREGTVHEVSAAAEDGDGHARLDPLSSPRLASEIERFGAKIMALETREDGTPRWRAKTMGENHCRVLLHSSAAREFLPPIRQLAAAPVLVSDGAGGTMTLGHGWHAHAGGTFITGEIDLPEMQFDDALPVFFELLGGFNFTTPADAARAAASFLSPAMKLGRWIDDDFPLDVAEADQSQAGKSYRHKLIAAIYGETPFQITNSTGGVGSLDERVAGALIAGRPIISLENIRGRMDSQTLESAIRGVGRVTARSFRACVEVDTSPFLWQLSTNGAELTRDLANRSVITRIRKQPDGYQFKVYPEGPILFHARANQPRFLAAVHAIVREWAGQGCPKTTETRHDFRQWVQVMDWIVQNLLGLAPLLDGHREEQMRTANPKLQWLRDIIHEIITHGHDPQYGVTASDLAEAADEHDIPLPGRRQGATESMEQAVGKVLSKLFRDAKSETITVDGRSFTRQVTTDYDPVNRKDRERKIYVIGTE
ncbi:MAG: hypothetical protein H7A48_14435 [Akkermansiaceae bacterium]|nr:hypothetical protein [Akkermansiaceae bacterium]